jgi:rRNA maturation endonuclease Nob1
MGDIFKNAKTSTKNYSEGIGEARKSAIRCKNCGAPRLQEMQYDDCLFCGSELFEPNN